MFRSSTVSRLGGASCALLCVCALLSSCASGAGDGTDAGADRDPGFDAGDLCGNGLVDLGEECDGVELLGASCEGLGYTGGSLSCGADCLYAKAECDEDPCGNGSVDSGEECDGEELLGQSCEGLGFTGGGTLGCGADCLYDPAECSACGDGVVDPGEECDGTNFGAEDCMTRGFSSGALSCDAFCGIDTAACVSDACGNGTREDREDCDGLDVGGGDCTTVGFVSGTLACDSMCTFDVSGCSNCGNDRLDSGEECDGSDLGGADCASRGFTRGTLRCSPACTFVTTSCENTACGNGLMETGEGCDDGNVAGGDGCSAMCAVESGFTCTGTPSSCDPVCGDAMILGDEECEGTNFGGATCASRGFTGGSLTCTACAIDTATCTTTTCGDGTLDTGEECDDGARVAFDGCDGACQVEPAFYLPVRLTGGEGSNHGRLEVRFEGTWRDVCDDTYVAAQQQAMANVVCAQLGYTGTGHQFINAFGGGSGTPVMDDVHCDGTETTLAQCPFAGWGKENCSASEAVGIRCMPGTDDIRLVAGPHGMEGRLQIYHSGSWGEVCDDYFDGAYTAYLGYSTTTVCQQLGYAGGDFVSTYDSPTATFVLDDVNCSGTERRIADCAHQPFGTENCSTSEGAGFRCRVYENDGARLVGGSNRANGRVEVLHQSVWGTVCDDFISSAGARQTSFVQVGCRQLGFTTGGSVLLSVPDGVDPVWMDDLDCGGAETAIASCPFAGWGIENCSHFEDVGLSCVP